MGSGTMDPNERDRPTTPRAEPAEGGPKMAFPGADTESPADRSEDLPQRLGERIESGPDRGIATGEPDLLPDVGPPDDQM